MPTRFPRIFTTVLTLCLCAVAWAWKPAKDTVGPLTVSIVEFGDVGELGKPIPVTVVLENSGNQPLSGRLRMGVIDDWAVDPAEPRGVEVPAKGRLECEAAVTPGLASYSAHYPVHAHFEFQHAGQLVEAHAVFVTFVAPAALGSKPTAKAGLGRLEALRTEAPVKVDGDLFEWGKATAVPLGQELVSTGSVSPGDFAPILHLLHDGSTLYIGLRVTDDDISAADVESRDFVNSDYTRLYLSGREELDVTGASIGRDDLVLSINPLAEIGPRVKVPDYGPRTRTLADMSAIKVAARKTAAGYDEEVAVPLSLVGDGLSTGAELGFNLMLGDSDKGVRQAEVTIGSQSGEYWTNRGCYVRLRLSALTEDDGSAALPLTTLAGAGPVALDRLGLFRVTSAQGDAPFRVLPVGWTGSDQQTGTTFAPVRASRSDAKPSIGIHPPYRGGAGRMWAETRFRLPDITPIALTFATAIRDHNPETEPPSDGVEWRVQVALEGGAFQEVFKRFSASKVWEPAEVDLSAFAGQTITLRLWNGPGPKNNTTCDSGYWGEPTLMVGEIPKPEDPVALQERRDRAIRRARAALAGRPDDFGWLVENSAGRFGVGWAAGAYGFADGALAFATDDEAVVFDEFIVEINGQNLRDPRSEMRVIGGKTERDPTRRSIAIRDFVADPQYNTITAWTEMWAEDGAFKIHFSMPTDERNVRGEPRFTCLGPGPATIRAKRVYAGFGNVIQEPGKFTLGQGGFTLSTRHVGMDFENGISLVQAADVFPYRFEVDPDRKLYSLQTGHDATLMFVPSERGAFAAARVYRDLSGFEPADGVEKLKGKMCIDWWGGHDIAADIRRAGAYGLNDSVFVKHAWQRHGYDYRLPDIYPPSCDPAVWDAWVKACKDAGMLCAVHDNYIDFYPDASGFSYRHILFNRDGTPQRAWFHSGFKAQSYRWLPGAYKPWLERNIRLIREGFAPTAYFIDVFSAIPLLDYYDHEGRFHTKLECAEHWGRTFDYVRQQLGDNAPQISEAGHDGLVGHLDGAQADHNSAKAWGWQCGDADRTPWHDMATHGSFVLLAGGLGPRYAGNEPFSGWASDDYLSNTVMGGRNPMCIGPCTRDTVMTYWLQHDICQRLARESLEAHEFAGDDIHRQHTTFGGGGEVWVNRGDTPWVVNGRTLPKFGYLAVSGDVLSEIALRDGLSTGFAQSPGATFVDARPQSLDVSSRAPIKTRVLAARHLGAGKIEADIEWEVLSPLPDGYQTFVHVCHDKAADQGERIAIHSNVDLPPSKLQEVGVHLSKTSFTIPADLYDGEYQLRYGLYSPSRGGGRILPIAYMDDTRVRGGILTVIREDGKIKSVDYRAELPPADAPKLNLDGRMIDFGPIVTNGAFRLVHESPSEWRLLPLQGSFPFQAVLKLDELPGKPGQVSGIDALSQDGEKQGDVTFTRNGRNLELNLDAKAFSYRIRFE